MSVEPSSGRRTSGERVSLGPDLVGQEVVPGQKPGDRLVRIVRPVHRMFRRVGPGHLEAREEAHEATGDVGRLWQRIRRVLIGRPLATSQQAYERLTKVKALAVLSSDALSSSAYATEEILRVVVLAGVAALSLTLPIAFAITALLTVVAISYRQTIKAYPLGGGSYIVTKDNLGTWPSLVAGAALMIDYVLTVAVSISAGVAALTSAFQDLHAAAIELGLLFVIIITMINLRGVRESGTIFAAPTYLFVGMAFAMIGLGLVRLVTEGPLDLGAGHEVLPVAEPLTIFLILRAFASGNAALTGLEAISDGVPAFKPPEWRNARITLTWMAAILGCLFVGISFLAVQFRVIPSEQETIISQLGRAAFGDSVVYLVFQASTMLILVLAANTAFSDFPRLAYFLARDRFLPSVFQFRGERLAFSSGIVVLGLLAGALISAFHAETHALIPLYAVGVFVSFTLSQASMVVRWWRRREPGWRAGLPVNLVGAVCTGVVAVVVAATKFHDGAWMVILLLPILVLTLRSINAHYVNAADEMALEHLQMAVPTLPPPTVLVPVAGLNLASLRTLAFARSFSSDVTALYVTDDMEDAASLRRKWEQWEGDIPLVVLESPYRSLTTPLLAYVDAMCEQRPDANICVVVGEFVPRHWWEYLLHGQSALRLKAALFFRPNVAVVNVPYHLKR